MSRRGFLFTLCIAASAATDGTEVLRGRLRAGRPATIGDVTATGDEDTLGVLADDRLDGVDFEALGHRTGEKQFDVNRIHTRSLFVNKGGKRLMVTYWCDVCYIRTYTPGKCWCCQKNTDLDLRESIPVNE